MHITPMRESVRRRRRRERGKPRPSQAALPRERHSFSFQSLLSHTSQATIRLYALNCAACHFQRITSIVPL